MKLNSFLAPAAKSPEVSLKFFIILIGALLVFGGVIYSISNLYWILTFEQTAAKVASIGTDHNEGKMPVRIYSIWVGFDLPKQIVYTRAGKSIFYSPYKKGDVVTVYYNPQDPNEAFVHTFGTTWFTPFFFLFLPGFALCLWMLPGIYRAFYPDRRWNR